MPIYKHEEKRKSNIFVDFSIMPSPVTVNGETRNIFLFTLLWDIMYPKTLCLSSPVPLHSILKSVWQQGTRHLCKAHPRGQHSSNPKAYMEQSLLILEIMEEEFVRHFMLVILYNVQVKTSIFSCNGKYKKNYIAFCFNMFFLYNQALPSLKKAKINVMQR